MKDIVYFDLETQRSAAEVGGWNKICDMGMSVGVTFNTARGTYEIYSEDRVNDLVTELQRAGMVVGFNHIGFDYEVLHGYTVFDLKQIPSFDILLNIQKLLNHKLSLEAVATATLEIKKTAEGLQAIKWFKEGRILDIAEYCCYDVKITRMVHEYGMEHGEIFYYSRMGEKKRLPVDWALTFPGS